jgi:hypothetical protein
METNKIVATRPVSSEDAMMGTESRRPRRRMYQSQMSQSMKDVRVGAHKSFSTRCPPPRSSVRNYSSASTESSGFTLGMHSSFHRLPPRSPVRSGSPRRTELATRSESIGVPPRRPSLRRADSSFRRTYIAGASVNIDQLPIEDPRKTFYPPAPKKKTSAIRRRYIFLS